MDENLDGYRFSREHEWVREEEDGTFTIGISHYAQDALGDIVFVELPSVGETLEAEEEFGVVESVKAVSDLYAPITGEVVEINDELEDSPELINESPYGSGWIVRVKIENRDEFTALLDVDGYEEFLKQSE